MPQAARNRSGPISPASTARQIYRPSAVAGRISTRICDGYTHLRRMLKSVEFALPVKATEVPNGPDWLHEVKHDGYRMQVIRERDRVRLKTMGGHDYTKRYPWIVETARKLKRSH